MATRKLIGTDPDQVPVNGDLGTLAFQDSESVRVTNLRVDGDLTVDGERMRIDSAGNVGIGTSSPGAKLTVKLGNIGIDQDEAPQQFFGAGGNVAGTNTTGGVLTVFGHAPNAFGDTSTPPYDGTNFVGAAGLMARGFSESAQYRGSLEFFTKTASNANATSRMIITHDGNVGIGTSSPAYKLDVSKGSAGLAARFTASTDNGRGLSFTSSDVGIFLGAQWTRDVASASGIHAWSINGSERMRIDSSGHLIVPEGITLGTAAGTYNAANTLDDYEEGTWTPSIGGDATYVLQTGTYTKIGNVVHISARLHINIKGTGSGTTFSGLPFTNGSLAVGVSLGKFTSAANSFISAYGEIAVSASTGELFGVTTAGNANYVAGFFTDGTSVNFSATYTV